MIHKQCEKCPWLNAKDERCNGNIVDDEPMYVGNLREGFTCGQKTEPEPSLTYIININPKDVPISKTEYEELKEKVAELEAKEVSAIK